MKRSVSFREEHAPKKAHTEKLCDLCKKHGGAHTTHNTGDCKKYNAGGALKSGPNLNRESPTGMIALLKLSKTVLRKLLKPLRRILKRILEKGKNASTKVTPTALEALG